MNKVVSVIYANVINGNDRIYTTNVCDIIIKDFYKIKNSNGVVFGELDHPDSFEISMNNISHTVNDMWIENNILMAEITILNTEKGKLLEEQYENMVFSSRSAGAVDPLTKQVIIQNFLTIDAIDCEKDAYYKQRVREKKLKRILKDGL